MVKSVINFLASLFTFGNKYEENKDNASIDKARAEIYASAVASDKLYTMLLDNKPEEYEKILYKARYIKIKNKKVCKHLNNV